MKTSVQYQSALINIDNKEILVDINEAKNYEGKFSCPYCHDEMFARCGQHNAKHFVVYYRLNILGNNVVLNC